MKMYGTKNSELFVSNVLQVEPFHCKWKFARSTCWFMTIKRVITTRNNFACRAYQRLGKRYETYLFQLTHFATELKSTISGHRHRLEMFYTSIVGQRQSWFSCSVSFHSCCPGNGTKAYW